MKRINYKFMFLKLAVPAAVLGPVAVVVACGESDSTDTTNVQISAQNLSKVQVSGDTKNIVFNIPKELVYVNSSNALDAKGTTKAFDVYVRATVKVGTNLIATNTSFMPTELLSSYLSGKLSYKNGALVASSASGDVNVQQRYGGLFDFTQQSVNALNNTTYAGEWTVALEGRYQALGKFTASDSYELNLFTPIPITSLKKYVILTATENELAPLGAKLTYTAQSTNDSVTWDTPVLVPTDLPLSWTKYVSAINYSTSAPTTVASAIVWTQARPITFVPVAASRNLLLGLVPTADYVLSVPFYDATLISKVRDLTLKIDSLPEYAAADLTKVEMSALEGTLVIDESKVTLPEGTRLEYQIGNGTYYTAAEFPAEVKKLNILTTSNINVHLGLKEVSTKYVLGNDKKAKPNVSQLLGFVDTTSYFVTLVGTLKVNLSTSTPAALVWDGTPVTVPSSVATGIQRTEYLAGDYTTLASARAATAWSTTLPTAIDAGWKDFNLWVRVVPKNNYLFNALTQNLSSTSGLNAVTPNTNIDALVQQANQIAVANTSTHDEVTWSRTLSIPATLVDAIQSVEYASGKYATEEALFGVTWSSNLPTSVNFESTDRNIWVRFNPKPGYKFAQRVHNITQSSGIAGIKGKVDALPAYTTLDFAQVKIKGVLTNPTIDTSLITVPGGSKITYSLKSSGWLEQAAFITYLTTNAATISVIDFAQIQARLESRDSALYVVLANKQKVVNTSELSINIATLPAALTTILERLKAQTTSTHDTVIWNAIDALPLTLNDQIASIRYLSGSYTDSSSFNASTVWSATLPTSVAYNKSLRNIWVKITPNQGYTFATPYYNITESSEIRNVKSKVDSELSSTFSLTAVTITGTPSNITINENAVTLPAGAVINYQFKGGSWMTAAALKTAIQAIASIVVTADISSIRARLELDATSSSSYIIIDRREASPNTSGVLVTTTSTPPSDTVTTVRAIRPVAGSNSSRVTWSPVSLTPQESVKEVKYLSGEYSTQALAAAASESLWKAELPTSVDFEKTKRYLWAKVVPNTGFSFANPYVDLSYDSTVRTILSLVDSDANYSLIDLSKITISGTTKAPTISESVISATSGVVLPRGAKISYKIKTSDWVSSARLLQLIIESSDILLLSDIRGITAKIESSNVSEYVVSADKSAVVTVPMKLVVPVREVDLVVAGTVREYVGWTHNDPRIDGTQAFDFVSSSYIASFSYLYIGGTSYAFTDLAPAQAASSSDWKNDAPTSLDPDHKKRNLWIRFNPKDGYQISNPYYNATENSHIRNIATNLVYAYPDEFRGLTFSTATLTGTKGNPTLNVTLSKALPPYTALTYNLYLNGNVSLSSVTADELLTYIRTTTTNITSLSIIAYVSPTLAANTFFNGAVLVWTSRDVGLQTDLNVSGFTPS